jgi:hypothetical protein
MVKKNAVIAGGILLVIGLLIVYHVFYTEEAKIKRQFKALSERVSKERDETKLIAAATAKKIARMGCETIQIDIPSRSISETVSRKDLPAPIYNVRSRYAGMKVGFFDFVIDLSGKGTASVRVTGKLEGILLSGEKVNETHELACLLKKNEKDDWLFSRIEIVEVLEK